MANGWSWPYEDAAMSPVDGVGDRPPTAAVSGQGAPGRADNVRLPSSPAIADPQAPDDVPAFDVFAAVMQAAHDAVAPPEAGLQAKLLAWAAPTTRQFEAVSPARLLPLLGLAVDQLAQHAQGSDELDQFGSIALERELRDQHALAERRATLIGS